VREGGRKGRKERTEGGTKRETEKESYSCNPSYLGGRDQEDRGSKPAHANSA
jgi:hypothetical protein